MIVLKHLPNALTLSNLFCGCLTVLSILSDQLTLVPIFITISLLADYSDGLVARLLKVSSPMGRELDSLADMVSFGVVPGMMLFYMINKAEGISMINFSDTSTYLGLVGFVVTVFSCLRLAKFNLDTRQTEGFVGLNTPACTIFVLGILLLEIAPNNYYGLQQIWTNTIFLVATSCVLAYLLVAEIPMFSFKFKSLSLNENKVRFSFIIISIACLILFEFGAALSVIILNYILISVILWMGGLLKREKREF